MRDANKYTIECIDLECWPGTTIVHQQRLACLAAIEHQCNARFVHNDRCYLVVYDDVMRQCREMELVSSGHKEKS